MDYLEIQRTIRSNPVFYGKWIITTLVFIIAYLIEPSSLLAYLSGFTAGHGYAEGVYHYYAEQSIALRKIPFAQYACFGMFAATALTLNRMYQDGTIQWYVISAFMISSSFSLVRLLKREYRHDMEMQNV